MLPSENLKSSCRHAKEVANTVVVPLIFIRVAMEKLNPFYLFVITGKEEEETNP
jgi:hypothetical protein